VKKLVAKPYKKRRYYTLAELQAHCSPNDIWVSFFDDVYDLTRLVQQNRHLPTVDPIIAAAGSDITAWFDEKTKEPRTFVDAEGKEQFYIPLGRYLHLELKGDPLAIPWWKNQEYFIGKLTKKAQPLRIINTLSDTEDTLLVPREETLWEILARYEQINAHARSYTWKRKGKVLNMEATLADNGIVDQSEQYEELEVPPHLQYIPAVHLHFNDDLTSK
jgi:cytochrome b involved in lipid metabolism